MGVSRPAHKDARPRACSLSTHTNGLSRAVDLGKSRCYTGGPARESTHFACATRPDQSSEGAHVTQDRYAPADKQ